MSIFLDHPHKLFAGMVEVELELVGGGTNGLVTRELELLNEVLVGVLGHSAALIGIKEDVVHVEGSRHEGLVVCGRCFKATSSSGWNKSGNSPEALVKRAELKVDLDLVVLESNEGEGESRVAAEPELERHVEGGLREGVTGLAHLAHGAALRGAGTSNLGELGVSHVGELGGLANHLVVATLLLGGHRELVPDVHPVTELAVNTLATNLNLHHAHELLAGVVQPAGVCGIALLHLREGHLKVDTVGEVTITGDSALNTASEIGLTVEGLFNRFHGEVGVATVSHLPESNLGVTSEVNVLRAVGDELH